MNTIKQHLGLATFSIAAILMLYAAAWHGMNRTLCYNMKRGVYGSVELQAMALTSTECAKY